MACRSAPFADEPSKLRALASVLNAPREGLPPYSAGMALSVGGVPAAM